MQIKDGVFTRVTVVKNSVETNLEPSDQIKAAWTIADEISKKVSAKEIVITSILDGKHGYNSKHYVGDAIDIRTYIYTTAEIKDIMKLLKIELGEEYDVVQENNHIHIEFDPK